MAKDELTARDLELLRHFVAEVDAVSTINWDSFAARAGQKYARNGKAAFKRIWEKLDVEKSGADGEASTPPKKITRAPRRSAKKGVGATSTPKKAGAVNASANKACGGKKVKKEASDTENENEEDAEFDEGSGDEVKNEPDTDGKSPASNKSHESASVKSQEEEVDEAASDYHDANETGFNEAGFNAAGFNAQGLNEEGLTKQQVDDINDDAEAFVRSMTREEYREFKASGNIDPHGWLYEEDT